MEIVRQFLRRRSLSSGLRLRARRQNEGERSVVSRTAREQIQRALIRSLVQREYNAIFSSLAGVFVVLLVAYPLASWPAIVTIAVLRLASLSASVAIARNIQRALKEGRDIAPGLRRLTISSAVASFTWGVMLWPLEISGGNSMAVLIIILAVILAVSLQSVTNAYYRPVLRAVLTGAVLSIGPKIYIIYQTTGMGLPIGASVLLGIVYGYARANEARARKMIVLQVKNRRISQRLQAANRKISEALAEATWYAQRDPLTGLRNRRAFVESLQQRLDSGELHDTTYLCVLDIDHFKSVNDDFGHAVGDRVLKAASHVLETLEEQGELLLTGRWGGEEFVLLIAADNPLEARTRLELVRQQVGQIHHNAAGLPGGVRVRASAGAAHLSRETGINGALLTADIELYKAKDLGRNCLRMAA